MSSPMSYSDFTDSLNQNKLHFVSGRSIGVKGVGILHEPAYVLESSGSVAEKIFVHSLSSIEAACTAFLKTFKMTVEDRWGLCLSTSHVAGFSVLARTHFGGLKDPYFFNWSKENLVSEVRDQSVTVLSLVPTQIFDLVKMSVTAPPCLRMVFVGGAKLSKNLREQAVKLGWPIVECYGSTETFAQMSYSIDGGKFELFKGWSLRVEDSEIQVSGPGLFKAQVKEGVYRTRKQDWFGTGDLGASEGEKFEVLGKKGGLVKIKGSYFDFNKVKSEFSDCLLNLGGSPEDYFLTCLKEERSGAGLYMVAKSSALTPKLLEKFGDIRGVFYLDSVERSALGKIKSSSLEDALKKTVLSL